MVRSGNLADLGIGIWYARAANLAGPDLELELACSSLRRCAYRVWYTWTLGSRGSVARMACTAYAIVDAGAVAAWNILNSTRGERYI